MLLAAAGFAIVVYLILLVWFDYLTNTVEKKNLSKNTSVLQDSTAVIE